MFEGLQVLGKEIYFLLGGKESEKKLRKSQKIADLGGDGNRKKLVGFFQDFSGFVRILDLMFLKR